MMIFKDHLRFIRKNKKFTQKEVAQQFGLSLRSYQRYEYGEREPTSTILIALADYFDVSLDYLVGRSDNPNSHKL